jgi:hypothetical protein
LPFINHPIDSTRKFLLDLFWFRLKYALEKKIKSQKGYSHLFSITLNSVPHFETKFLVVFWQNDHLIDISSHSMAKDTYGLEILLIWSFHWNLL